MSDTQNFRGAFNGFNREDVVHYIEYLNHKHNAQITQLNAEIQSLQEELSQLRREPVENLEEQLQRSQQECDELREKLEEINAQMTSAQPAENLELETYRRAERAERLASERVEQMYLQANGTLADATGRVDEASQQIGKAADQMLEQLTKLQTVFEESKLSLQSASAAMYAIRPLRDEELTDSLTEGETAEIVAEPKRENIVCKVSKMEKRS